MRGGFSWPNRRDKAAQQADLYGSVGSRRCGQDNAVRSAAVFLRYAQKTRAGGHRDAFLDTFALERERGITIFSKQAELSLAHTAVTCWTRRVMWIFPLRWSAPCRCWTMRCWSSAERTACRRIRKRSGGCLRPITSRPFCLSTRWISQALIALRSWTSCAAGWMAAASISARATAWPRRSLCATKRCSSAICPRVKWMTRTLSGSSQRAGVSVLLRLGTQTQRRA